MNSTPRPRRRNSRLVYAAKGLPSREANRLARRIIADPDHALDTLAREELGLNPGELGSPLNAAVSSFFAFAAGAALPLVPLLFMTGTRALLVAIVASGAALFAVGATLSLFTGRSAMLSGVRMLALGALAGGVTFGIGRLTGVALG